jgi:hypothetical protein
MKTIIKTIQIKASPEKVFETLDNLGVIGMHMTQSSAMKMGSKLHLEYLTDNHYPARIKVQMDRKNDGNENGFYSGSNKMAKGY